MNELRRAVGVECKAVGILFTLNPKPYTFNLSTLNLPLGFWPIVKVLGVA
ncbi:hypothetical protein SRABI27_01709 [Pedobacter sp. Bi27]|nr:hypothetical protein SRABI27_01709 [Pedobacter sp. Bi27]